MNGKRMGADKIDTTYIQTILLLTAPQRNLFTQDVLKSNIHQLNMMCIKKHTCVISN